jgi:hypothetical protein
MPAIGACIPERHLAIAVAVEVLELTHHLFIAGFNHSD